MCRNDASRTGEFTFARHVFERERVKAADFVAENGSDAFAAVAIPAEETVVAGGGCISGDAGEGPSV